MEKDNVKYKVIKDYPTVEGMLYKNEIVKLDTLICHALGVKPDTRRLSAADGKEDTRKD